jgi:hypothetical protein
MAFGLMTIVIYNFLLISGIHHDVPFTVGDIIVIAIACIFLIAGIADGYPETRHYISPPLKTVYSATDPSILGRVVNDGPEGHEYIVHGSGETSFREACTANWQFKYIDRKSDWIAVDNRGNDVSDEPLSRSDGLFTLIRQNGTDELSDRVDESSSIDDSVEYYN